MLALVLVLAQAATPTPPPPPTPPPTPTPVLTLAEAERRAEIAQPQIAQARATTSAAWARADGQRSGLLPQVTGNASYARRTQNFVSGSVSGLNGPSNAASFDTYNSWSFGVSASQLVWDFGQTYQGWKSAEASAEAVHENEAAVHLGVILNVRSAYLAAWAQHALIVVLRENLANQDRHLEQVSGMVRVGTRPEIDLAQVRADRANAQLQLINAENAYETAKAQLNLAMGVEQSTDYDVADERFAPVDGEEQTDDRLTQLAVGERPELRQLARQAEAQERQLTAVKGAYGPSLGVSTGITEAGRELPSMTWNWNATANLTWPIFQGGLTRAQIREVESNQAVTTSQQALQRQQIRLEVTQARLAVRAGKASLATAKEVEVNARERLRLAERRYQAGAGSIIELQDAQVAATQASGQVVQADYALSLARAQLVKALGRR